MNEVVVKLKIAEDGSAKWMVECPSGKAIPWEAIKEALRKALADLK